MKTRRLLTLMVSGWASCAFAACGGQSDTDPSGASGGSTGAGGTGSGAGGAFDAAGGIDSGTGGVLDAAGGTGSEARARCDQLLLDYGVAAAQAARCNPVLSSMQCRATRVVGLHCGCPKVVEASASNALRQLDVIEAAWYELGCDAIDRVVCGPCAAVVPSSVGGGCSPDGQCLFEVAP